MRNSGTWRDKKARKSAKISPNIFEFGEPKRPRGLPRASRNAWNTLCSDLLRRRILSKTDGTILLELIAARANSYHAAGEKRTGAKKRLAEIEATFEARQPFPESTPAEVEPAAGAYSLSEFLAATAQQRASFRQRLKPGQTPTLDLAVDGLMTPYTWNDHTDAAVRAQEFAQGAIAGRFPACDLLKRACARFIADLDHGAEKGFFFDPAQARAIDVWFRDFLKMPLEDWQLFVCVNLAGWRLPSGLRRFRDCWVWVARQNGKSQMAAGIGLFLMLADGEDCAEVYSAATTRAQAGIIFRTAKRFVTANEELKAAVKRFRYAIVVEETDSSFQPLASEVSSLDGLRPACLAADEIHEWDNAGGREQWAKLTSGMVSRANPLTLAVSTSGGQQHGFGWEKYSMVRKILTGIFPAEDVFCCVWELDETDDYKDHTLWAKANPALLGGHLKIEALEKQFAETEQDPSALNSFLRYQGNRWVSFNKTAGSIPLAKWDECRGYPDKPEASPKDLVEEFLRYNIETPFYIGFDWGEINDLACAVFMFPYVRLADQTTLPVKVLIPFFWMPEAFVQQREREWQVPISNWVREGWISTCPGDINDARQVIAEIVEYASKILTNARSCGYDPWHSRQIAAAIGEDARVECVEVPQKPSVLTPLAVTFKSLIYDKNIWHLANPVCRWMAGNVRLEREGKYGVIIPTKPDKTKKIDAIQAALSALHRLENAPPPSVYLNHGILLV